VSDFNRIVRDSIHAELEKLNVHDAISLLKHIPTIVRWFRARKYDEAAIERDAKELLGRIGEAADKARADLNARFPASGDPPSEG
jgi:hypothetical protein